MPTLTRLDPPGKINDLQTDAQLRQWSDKVSKYFDDNVTALQDEGLTPQFYNPLKTETTAPVTEKVIDWEGFPKLVRDSEPTREAAWKKAEPTQAEPRRRIAFQDEYLEWNVVRNAANKITRVSFTCEAPEYWDFLAKNVPQKLLALYQQLVDPALKNQVKLADLIVGGSYRPQNKWNTLHGAVHLIQPNNNLFAEITIAGQATILRKNKNGQPVTDAAALADCGGFGAAGRNSDPRIGIDVQNIARDGFAITLKNPVALYITNYDSSTFKKPDGSPVGNYWNVVRGTPKMAAGGGPAQVLHLVYEVPASEGFAVGDIKIANRTIDFGGQIAEFVRVGLTGLACREDGITNAALPCKDGQGFAPAGALESVGGLPLRSTKVASL